MSVFIVDIEADGPIPGEYSMIEIGAVLLKSGGLTETFHSQIKPISKKYSMHCLSISGHTREDTLKFEKSAEEAMLDFEEWVAEKNVKGTPQFWSDNNGFDWMFVCWYMWKFLGRNVFGHSSTNIGSLYKGAMGSVKQSFKKLRKTKHTHHPVDDAMGNAQAVMTMIKKYHMINGVDIAPGKKDET